MFAWHSSLLVVVCVARAQFVKQTILKNYQVVYLHSLDFFRLTSKFLFYYRGANQLASFLTNFTAATLELQSLSEQQLAEAGVVLDNSSSVLELHPNSVPDVFVITCLRTMTSIRNENVLLHYLRACTQFTRMYSRTVSVSVSVSRLCLMWLDVVDWNRFTIGNYDRSQALYNPTKLQFAWRAVVSSAFCASSGSTCMDATTATLFVMLKPASPASHQRMFWLM
jgi:hypothetical protein